MTSSNSVINIGSIGSVSIGSIISDKEECSKKNYFNEKSPSKLFQDLLQPSMDKNVPEDTINNLDSSLNDISITTSILLLNEDESEIRGYFEIANKIAHDKLNVEQAFKEEIQNYIIKGFNYLIKGLKCESIDDSKIIGLISAMDLDRLKEIITKDCI